MDKGNLNQLIKGWLRTEDGPRSPESIEDIDLFNRVLRTIGRL